MTDDRTPTAPRPTGLDWAPTALPPKTVIPASRIVLPGIDKPLAPPTEVPDVTELVPPDAAALADPAAVAAAAVAEARRAAEAVGATLDPPVAPAVREHPPALAEVMAQSGQHVAFPARAVATRGSNGAATASVGFGVLALVMLLVGLIGGYQAGDGDLGGWITLFLLAAVPCLVAFITALVGLARPPRGRAAIGLVLSIAANPLLWAVLGGAFG